MCTKARTMKRQILLLRGLAILAVVAHHAAAWGFVAMFWWTHRYTTTSVPDYGGMGSPAYWLLMVPNQAALFSVPAFLFISGLSAAYSVGTGPLRGDWRIVRARLGAIIGPYLVWSLVMFAIDAALGVRLSPAEYLGRLLIGRAVDAYYFVPLLVQFYLVSPLVVRGVRSRPWAVLGVAAALQAACTLLPYLGFSTVTAAGTLAMVLSGLDGPSALSSVAATLNLVGPGLGEVGATDNYGAVSQGGRVVLAFLMLAGRLEVFTVLVLLTPAFWRPASA